jgi:hypothetical protein
MVIDYSKIVGVMLYNSDSDASCSYTFTARSTTRPGSLIDNCIHSTHCTPHTRNCTTQGLLRRAGTAGLGGWATVSDSGASTSSFSALRAPLRLVSDPAASSASSSASSSGIPEDMCYVSSGYAPLSGRLVQTAVKPGWSVTAVTDLLKLLPSPTLEFTQVSCTAMMLLYSSRTVCTDSAWQACINLQRMQYMHNIDLLSSIVNTCKYYTHQYRLSTGSSTVDQARASCFTQ